MIKGKNQNNKEAGVDKMKNDKVSSREGTRQFSFYMDNDFHKVLSDAAHNNKELNIGAILNQAAEEYIKNNYEFLGNFIHNPETQKTLEGIAHGKTINKKGKTG